MDKKTCEYIKCWSKEYYCEKFDLNVKNNQRWLDMDNIGKLEEIF